MNKIESARIIVKQNGHCAVINCKECFTTPENCGCDKLVTVSWTKRKIKHAKAYIKRHEQKSKKKDHIRDTTKKVESTAVSYEPCVSCRNNHGLCSTKERTANVKNCVSYDPIDIEKSYFKNISANEPKPVKTVGIDNSDVTLAKPTVKESLSVPCEEDCPANSEYPDPIRVDIPDIFYCPTPQGILRFKRSQILLKDTNNDDCLLKYHEEYPCYRTIEEAVIVAKRLWSIK